MRPTVLIVDDHAAFRASARALLQAEGFDVIGEATDGAEAVEAVVALRPEIVLLSCPMLTASRSPSSSPPHQTPPQ